jgi:TrmH family RNA methyltransferase
MIRPIQSEQNENFKNWKQLDSSKMIRKQGRFFLMGEKLIREFLKKPKYEILAEVMGPQHHVLTEGRAYDHVPKYQLTQELFRQVDVLGTHFNLLLLTGPPLLETAWIPPEGLEIILPLGDPGNLGASLRSAAAFGVRKVHLTEEAAWPFHPKCIKASAGAALDLEFTRCGSLREVLNMKKENMMALDQEGTDITQFQFPKNLWLVVGEEGPGLPDHSLGKISIPTAGVESLNAAIALSLAMFSFRYSTKFNH